jgi:hypothetical protein
MSETLLAPVAFAFDFKSRPGFVMPKPLAKTLRRTVDPETPPNSDWQPVAQGCQPAAHHFWRAGGTLRMRLISWHCPHIAACSDEQAATALVGDPAYRGLLAAATAEAAAVLGLAGPEIVLGRLDRLAREVATVETLRERLLEPAKLVVRRLATPRNLDAGAHTQVRQTGLLLISALAELTPRLQEADAATHDIVQALASVEASAGLMRANCAGLARRYPGLAQALVAWTRLEGDTSFTETLAKTHAFLMALSMRQTAQSTEDHHDRLDQIRPIRNPRQGIAAAYRGQQ